MEPWLEATLILLALGISIASLVLSTLLYISTRSSSKPMGRSTGPGRTRGSRYVKRYLVFRIYRIKGEVGFEDLDGCFKKAVTEHLGILGSAETSLKLIRYNIQSGVGVVRVVSPDVYGVIFAVSRLRRCGGSVMIVMPILITGTLKKAINRAQEYEGRYR